MASKLDGAVQGLQHVSGINYGSSVLEKMSLDETTKAAIARLPLEGSAIWNFI